jgi:sortase A
VEYLCWFAGAVLVAYAVFWLWSAADFQARETARLQAQQHEFGQQHELIQETAPHAGELLGKISIARLGISAIVAEGVDDKTLRHAVGHFPQSSFPDQPGNVALAGHRDTFFRGLSRLRVKDIVMLETAHGKFEYEVIRTAVVSPSHVEYARSSSPSDLTLVTCFPFHYVGPAPNRFVVQAVRIHSR